MAEQTSQQLLKIYHRLLDCYGPQNWWPAEEPFEVIVGAILTQSSAWSNVEKAITRLKLVEALSPSRLRQLPLSELATLIYSCGYYNAKALKLKSFAHWLGGHYEDSLDKLFSIDTDSLRQQLLSIHGIGEETADSILLYAGNKPIFVVDAYTRRVISRIGLSSNRDSYAAHQTLFMNNLPGFVRLFNEYHALIVQLGKAICRKRPVCEKCCLNDMCQVGNNASLAV